MSGAQYISQVGSAATRQLIPGERARLSTVVVIVVIGQSESGQSVSSTKRMSTPVECTAPNHLRQPSSSAPGFPHTLFRAVHYVEHRLSLQSSSRPLQLQPEPRTLLQR